MSSTVKFLIVMCLAFASLISAKPADDRIVFQDDDDYLSLGDENQVLPSNDDLKSFGIADENALQELEHGKFFQGDIVLLQEQKEYLLPQANGSFALPTRTGWIDESYRWVKDKEGNVIVPYVIDPSSKYSANQKLIIRFAMNDLERYTCVRFRERSTENDFIYIYDGDGCWSHMGRIGNSQELSLQKNGCLGRGTIIHELIHSLGYDHMHSHSDRDHFIEIKWNNIKPDVVDNFDKVDPDRFSNFGTTYDLYSLMHYDSKAFSKNGRETIVPRNRRFRKVIGQREGLSIGDKTRVNNMYKCNPKSHLR